MNIDADIAAFLAGNSLAGNSLTGDSFAVAGASHSRQKYGNKVLRCYWQNQRTAFPVNPHRQQVEGQTCFASLGDLPQPVHGVSLITQPAVSATIIDDALELGIRHFWFQPGAENRAAVERARQSGAVVIADGPCLLVVLGYDDRR